MLRRYLVDIHKFYYHFYNGSMNYAIMPVIVLSLTIISFMASVDILFNESAWIKSLKSIHRLAVVIPLYLVITLLYLFYRRKIPTDLELKDKRRMWNGIVVCVISVLLFLISSITDPVIMSI